MEYKRTLLSVLALLFLATPAAAYAASPHEMAPPPSYPLPSASLLQCTGPEGLFTSPGNVYVTTLSDVDYGSGLGTGFGSIVSLCMVIILAMLTVVGAAYAFGYAFRIEVLLNFSKAEIIECIANVAIVAAVGTSMAFSSPTIFWFANLAALGQGTSTSIPYGASAMYTTLCSGLYNNVILAGLQNFAGVFLNLYVTNFFAEGNPPQGGLTIHAMPNGMGVAFAPFQGVAVMTTELWDSQTTYFGTVFMGMFLIVLLFIIYFLFPLFLYVGIALRSFPWTRPAGGSLIALFISFYLVFPALMYPFAAASSSTPGTDPYIGKGFCQNSQFNTQFASLCDTSSFLSLHSFGDYLSLINFNFGSMYYSDIYSFIEGIEYVGLDLVGLIIAMLISYEMVEKLGAVLGAPSLQGSRALSRII